MRKSILLAVLTVAILAQVPVAEARRHGHHAGAAVAAGILGLGLGIAIAAPRTRYYSEPVIIRREYHEYPRYYGGDYYHDYNRRHYRRDYEHYGTDGYDGNDGWED